MNSHIKTLILCVACIFSLNVTAEWTDYRKISYLKAQTTGIHFKLESFVNDYAGTADCDDSFWMVKNDTSNYESRVSFLLAAFMSGKEVNVSFGECTSSHIYPSSVAIK